MLRKKRAHHTVLQHVDAVARKVHGLATGKLGRTLVGAAGRSRDGSRQTRAHRGAACALSATTHPCFPRLPAHRARGRSGRAYPQGGAAARSR